MVRPPTMGLRLFSGPPWPEVETKSTQCHVSQNRRTALPAGRAGRGPGGGPEIPQPSKSPGRAGLARPALRQPWFQAP